MTEKKQTPIGWTCRKCGGYKYVPQPGQPTRNATDQPPRAGCKHDWKATSWDTGVA